MANGVKRAYFYAEATRHFSFVYPVKTPWPQMGRLVNSICPSMAPRTPLYIVHASHRHGFCQGYGIPCGVPQPDKERMDDGAR